MNRRAQRIPLEEARLLREARDGSREARDRIVEHFRDVLLAHLQKGMGAQLERFFSVEDLAQETFDRALRALEHLDPGAGLMDFRALLLQHANWVLKTRGRKAQDFVAESAVRGVGGNAFVVDEPPTTGPVTRRDELRWLRRQFGGMERKYADVLELHLEGLPFPEIARRLEISEDASRKRYQRGLERMRLRADARRAREERPPTSER